MSTSAPEKHGLRVGSIWGVPVYIGASWFILAIAIVAITGQSLSGLGTTAYVIGALYTLALLVAVLLHEAAHAVAGRVLGLRVHRIVADLWGGHTSYDAEGTTPSSSALVALAGPAANFALGIAAYAVHPSLDGGVGQLLLWGIAWTNLLLAGFNLLPGLPLDGGQLVESAVWAVTGRRDRGLVAAGWSGRLVAALVVFWVLVRPVLLGRSPTLTTAIWVLLVAGFMWSGATSAIRHGHARRTLSAVRVGDLARPVVELPADIPLSEALQAGRTVVALDERHRPTLLLVTPEGGIPAGHVPLSAALTRLPDAAVIECSPEADITRVVQAMNSTGWGVCILTTGGAPYAVVDAETVNRALAATR